MTRSSLVGLCIALLAGCTTPEGERIEATRVLSVPFELAFKVPACVLSVAAAAPASAATYMAYPGPREQGLRRGLDDGIRHNCGTF